MDGWFSFLLVLVLMAAKSCHALLAGPLNSRAPLTKAGVPIVYVFKISGSACSRYKFPPYIVHALEQAVMTQPDSDVVMASNYADCPNSTDIVSAIPGVTLVDTTVIASLRTQEFVNTSIGVFQSDGRHELWITSALRFLNLEDIMRELKLAELMHVEADNMLYGRLSYLMPGLRAGYRGLAATPLTANKYFLTASLFWVPTLAHLVHFNDFLLEVGRSVEGSFSTKASLGQNVSVSVSVPENATFAAALGAAGASNVTAEPSPAPTLAPTSPPGLYAQYVEYLRPKACCRWGGPGHLRDENGTLLQGRSGIKPFMINEMTLLAFYKQLHPERLLALPVVPQMSYNLNRWVCNMSDFGPRGREVGPALHVSDALVVAQHRRQRFNISRDGEAAGLGVGVGLGVRGTVPGSSNSSSSNSSSSSSGDDVAPLDFLFDPNSWGQFLGGTFKSGKRGYQDIAHVVGQAMRTTGCQVEMLCGNSSMHIWRNISTPAATAAAEPYEAAGGRARKSVCYTAPFVFCGTFFPGGWKPPAENGTSTVSPAAAAAAAAVGSAGGLETGAVRNPPWSAIVNLHIHSKNTAHFVSQPCDCWL